jgi:hypothetical protein
MGHAKLARQLRDTCAWFLRATGAMVNLSDPTLSWA